MNAGVLAKVVGVGAGTTGYKFETWLWSAAFAAVKFASWFIKSTIGFGAAAMFAACWHRVATMVEVGAVGSVRESRRLRRMSERLFKREACTRLGLGEWSTPINKSNNSG